MAAGYVIDHHGAINLDGELRMNSSEWAAWVQAVFSVIAILAAAGIAFWQRKGELADRRADDLLRARDAAIAVAPALISWDNSMDSWRPVLASGEPHAIWGPLAAIAEDRYSLKLSDSIEHLAGNFRVLGPAAHAMQTAYVRNAELVANRQKIRQYWAWVNLNGKEALNEDLRKGFEALVRSSADSVRKAKEEVLALRDS